MATMNLSLVVGANTFPASTTLSNSDAARLQAWATAQYGPGTNQEIWERVAKGIFAGIKANVLARERATAEPVIPDISMT